jgi:hypothetical protein
MSTIKISQLPAKGANLEATDLVEISEFNGSGYVSKSITGQEIIDGASGGGVTDVTGTDPIVSTGGSTPDISIRQSGSIDDGYLSSSDWNTFNNKQDLLISGTNIKTINGSSVLGSGDLTISVGSGLKGLHNIFGYFDLTTQGISAQLTASGSTPVAIGANQMYSYPFFPNNTITSVSLKINVTTLGAGVNCRILIYSNVNGLPTTKLYESANLDCSTTGIKTATTSFTFTAGTAYWLCVQSSGTTSLSGIPTTSLIPLQMTSTPSSVPIVAYINSSTFGSAPTTFVINNRTGSTVPLVGIYLS